MFNSKPIIIVCTTGNCFRSSHSLTSNTTTFMYANKCLITTMDVIIKQQELAARNALKTSQSINNLQGLGNQT
jgi:hypothetical protein